MMYDSHASEPWFFPLGEYTKRRGCVVLPVYRYISRQETESLVEYLAGIHHWILFLYISVVISNLKEVHCTLPSKTQSLVLLTHLFYIWIKEAMERRAKLTLRGKLCLTQFSNCLNLTQTQYIILKCSSF
jgi:hypothetical protein